MEQKNNIPRDLQIALAHENNKVNDLYVQSIRDKSAELYHTTEEIATLRKAVKALYDAVVTQHPQIKERKEIADMLEWFDTIENIKANLRDELGLNKEDA